MQFMGGLSAALHAAGVHALYGTPVAGLDVVPVAEPRVATLMAAAHERVTGGRGGAVDGATITVPGRRDAVINVALSNVDDLRALPGHLVDPTTGARLRVDLDPAEPLDVALPVVDRWRPPTDDVIEHLQGASAPLVLVGPGVVLDGAIAGLQALAAGADLGVLNTWGAKGLFDWRSRHHLATAGLQERDAALGGVGDADVLVVSGLDPRESAPELWLQGTVVEVEPWSLAPLAEVWSRPRRGVAMPPLRDRLGAATQSGWAVTGAPLAPSQVTRNYGEVITAGGTVAADPGLAGYWVARTLGTTRPLAVHVPAAGDADGFAIACAVVARLHRPWAPALAVVERVDEAGLGVAAALGCAIGVEVWSAEGAVLDADGHRDRLGALVARGGVAHLAPGADQLAAMLDAAGPVTAWGGLAPRR